MTVQFHPAPGTIVRVDLNEGFRKPEMGKRRPAIVLSPELPGRPRLCSIVPLSTTAPKVVRSFHYLLTLAPPLPSPYSSPEMWVKGDMVLTVAFHRLRHLHNGKDEEGRRIYDIRCLEDDVFLEIQRCVARGLGMGHLFGTD
jgi:mRNA interferase MazF